MLAQIRRYTVAILLLGDGLLIGAAFVAAHWLRAHSPIFQVSALKPLAQCLPVLPLAVFAWLVIYAATELYDLSRPRTAFEWLISTTFSSALALLVLLATAFMLREFHASRLMLLQFSLLAAIVTGLWRVALWQLAAFMAKQAGDRAVILVVGTQPSADAVCKWMRQANRGADPIVWATEPGGESAFDLEAAIKRRNPQEVLFVGNPAKRLIEAAGTAGVKIRFIPDLPPLFLMKLKLEAVAGLPTLSLQELPAAPAQRFLKRALDIALSTAFLTFLAPLFLLLAAAIKLDSKGPVFFAQERIGKDGRPFRMFKFRSMHISAAKLPPVKVEGRNDPRVTRVGGWLRRLSLDELPQLFNVLLGSMSLVGPRPETPLYVEQYSDWNRLRLLVKPGMAGMAQANGVRGNTTIDEKTKYDLAYIESQSPALDLALLAKTVISLPLHRDAY